MATGRGGRVSLDPLFTVVMPVFNPPVERMERAIASVLEQDEQSWELLVVDDGSTAPEVRQLLDKVPSIDSRISVTTQSNAGPSVARNRGTDLASGAYVTYLDSDDELPPWVLGDARRVVEHEMVDLVLGYVGYIEDSDKRSSHRGSRAAMLGIAELQQLYGDILAGREISLEDARGKAVLKNGPVARFVRSEIARRVQFPETLPVSEDTIWNLRLLRSVQSAIVVNSVWYWYWISHESISRGFRPQSGNETEQFLDLLAEELRQVHFDIENADVTRRVLGEINRSARRYYCHPESNLAIRERMSGVKRLLMELSDPYQVNLRSAVQAGTRPFVKYVLFRTGAVAIVPHRLLESGA